MMNITQDILLGIALAMDCFAVSIASGIITKQFYKRPMSTMIGSFGLFQGGMTILGWFVTSLFCNWLEPVDHWISFGLLLIIGIQMLREGFSNEHEQETKFNPLNYKIIFTLAVATSIDAMAVGVSLILHVRKQNELVFANANRIGLVIILSMVLLVQFIFEMYYQDRKKG